MKDFLGYEIGVGDVVIFQAPNYRHFVKGTILKLTATGVRLSYINDWNYGKPGLQCDMLQRSDQVILER